MCILEFEWIFRSELDLGFRNDSESLFCCVIVTEDGIITALFTQPENCRPFEDLSPGDLTKVETKFTVDYRLFRRSLDNWSYSFNTHPKLDRIKILDAEPKSV